FSSNPEMKKAAGENRELIAVLSESNYLKLKNRISSRAVNTLSCHIDFPAAQSGRERKIYVLQLKPNQKR
ncbi:hypothetical protein, partial [Syntrophomonas palmitatica]|uniref:hypothetical protein n=1 Tax=Syntrophomonas palmitatica TaxID=402877 RepID=UPI000AB561B4